MKREYSGPPIDGTEQHISERDVDGETVAGTSDDDLGDERVDVWPDAVPREPFEQGVSDGQSLHTQIIEQLAIKDGPNQVVAERVGCSGERVRAVRNKVSVFAKPDDVGFRIPEFPGNYSIADGVMDHEEARFDANSTNDLDGGEWSVEEIGRRYYDDGEPVASIADDLGISVHRVQGKLPHYEHEEGSGQTMSAAGEPPTAESSGGDGPDCDWPEGLPLTHFRTSVQRKIICYLMDHPGASAREVADHADCVRSYVNSVLDKASIWVDPDDVPFPVRKVPHHQKHRDLAEKLGIELPDKDDRVEPLFGAQARTDDTGADELDVSAEEIARRRYEEDEPSDSIAEDLGVSLQWVVGMLGNYKQHSEPEESAQDPREVDADTPTEAVTGAPPSPVPDGSEETEMATRADGGEDGRALGQFVKAAGVVLAVWKLYDILTGRDSA